jgi:hypothetical protein
VVEKQEYVKQVRRGLKVLGAHKHFPSVVELSRGEAPVDEERELQDASSGSVDPESEPEDATPAVEIEAPRKRRA